MSFEIEKKAIWVVILAAIPLNPTNILADWIAIVVIDALFGPSSKFWWLAITFVLVAKIILAVMELEVLTEIWNIFFMPKKSKK